MAEFNEQFRRTWLVSAGIDWGPGAVVAQEHGFCGSDGIHGKHEMGDVLLVTAADLA